MFRKRKNPTHNFGLPPPYDPTGGEHASLKVEGIFPYCGMMQVAAEDVYANYVLCRGFDITQRRFIDYAEGDPDKPGIPVAKPFGNRVAGAYLVGQIFQANLPLQTTNPSPTEVDWRVRQNPGEAGDGHPKNLDEKVDEMYDHLGRLVHWMLIDSNAGTRMLRCVADDHFCQGEEIRVRDVVFLFQGGMEVPETIKNLLDHEGSDGDVLYAVWVPRQVSEEVSDSGSVSSSSSVTPSQWELISQQKKEIEYLDKDEGSSSSGSSSSGATCSITARRKKFMGIKPPDRGSDSGSSSSCHQDQQVVLATFEKKIVMDDWRVNGLCIDGHFIEVVRLASCDYADEEWIQLYCGIDCESSSSSSSG